MIKLYKKNGNKIQCDLCPNSCKPDNLKFGACNIRENINSKIINPYEGIISSSSLDPIEKKPLYHFLPGTKIYSVGFFGCTFKCQFCQNYAISQSIPRTNQAITPEEFVDFLIKNNYKSIAFTYSEPLLYYEWVYKTSKLCKEYGVKTVLVTNGYINPEPAKELLNFIDAANIDFKSSKDEFYIEMCSGRLEPVKDFIKIAFDKNVHIEITTLVITDLNDHIEECFEISEFISLLSKDIPYHISKYHPAYKLNKRPTSESTIMEWTMEASRRLNYVYAGNVSFSNDTHCKNCGNILINRDFYKTEIKNLNEDGSCKQCSTDNKIILR